MARCETCGNDYDKPFQVSNVGRTHTFDSFECAIQCLPRRANAVAAASSATASKQTARCIAAPIVPTKRGSLSCKTVHSQD
jgi:hypothetical protein